jgi:hypothetical protein
MKRSHYAMLQISRRLMHVPVSRPIKSCFGPSTCLHEEIYLPLGIRHISILSIFPLWHYEFFMDRDSEEVKESWLNQFIKDKPHEVDVEAFGVVLKALSHSHRPGAPQRAEEFLGKMKGMGLEPTVELYTHVIRSWANSKETTSIVRAERWFNVMNQSNLLTTQACNAFLDVCSRGKARKEAELLENARKAHDLLKFMMSCARKEGSAVKPNTDSFNFAMRAWTRCRTSEEIVANTMDILREMERLCRNHDDIQPNIFSYGIAMDALSTAGGNKARQFSQNKALLGLSHRDGGLVSSTNGLDEINKMEELLQYIHALHDNGVPDVAPNTVVYNTLLSAWARVSANPNLDAPFKAEELLRRMISLGERKYAQVKPDHRSYEQVIMAWGNTKRSTSGKRALFFLKKLWEAYEATNDESLRPQTSTYNAVLKAYNEDSEGMEEVLIEMLVNEEKNEHFPKANSESFSTVIHGLLSSERAQKCPPGEGVKRAMGWLDEVLTRENQGTGIASAPDLFHGVLKAAASCPRPEVLNIGLEVLQKYKASRHRVDPLAYAFLLKIGLKTLHRPENDNERTGFIYHVVEDCTDNGMLCRSFARELVNGQIYIMGWTGQESVRIVQEIFHEFPLPVSWTRNVKEEERANETHFVRTNWKFGS